MIYYFALGSHTHTRTHSPAYDDDVWQPANSVNRNRPTVLHIQTLHYNLMSLT